MKITIIHYHSLQDSTHLFYLFDFLGAIQARTTLLSSFHNDYSWYLEAENTVVNVNVLNTHIAAFTAVKYE